MCSKGEKQEVAVVACRFRSTGKLYGAQYEGMVVEVVEREQVPNNPRANQRGTTHTT